ncbi:hypothetical protein J2128_002069 [Methanomicrobium sp. W14]|nr:hypothetical protein [Methanomicrobium sp. W14]MBP2134103.1 hypothetical protein [Methanomicrobium sp. W14]
MRYAKRRLPRTGGISSSKSVSFFRNGAWRRLNATLSITVGHSPHMTF